jgi:hypothetical protein
MRSRILRFRSVLVGLLLSAFFASGFIGASISSANEESSASGAADFSSLQSCMNSVKASLNIVYIMDNSKSMIENDPDDARGPMMQSTLRILQQVGADSSKPVQYVMVPFGDNNTEQDANAQQWRKLTQDNLNREASTLNNEALKEAAKGTNWKSGLSVAKAKIEQQKKSDPGSCFVAIWLTDGAIDMNFLDQGYIPETGAAFVEICQSDELINWFRKPENNISMLAALLTVDSEETINSILFDSVIEGKAEIPQSVADTFDLTLGEDSSFTCGDIFEGRQLGYLVKNGNAADLSWQFVDLVASITGLKKHAESQNANSVDFKVPELIGKIRVYLKGDSQGSLKILDGQGIDVCSLPDVCRQISKSTDAGFEVWDVDVPKSGTSSTERWSIQQLPQNSASKVFVGINGKYKNLTLAPTYDPDLSEGTKLDEGRSVTAKYKLIDSSSVDLDSTDYESVEICLEAPARKCQQEPSVQFDLVVAEVNKKIGAKATIKLKDVAGDFVLTSVQSITVKKNENYAKILCEPSCSLNPIPNRNQKSVTILEIDSGKEGTSTIEVTGFKVEDNDPVRAKSYSIDSSIVTVAAGEPGSIEVTLSNSNAKTKENNLQGTMQYTVTNDGNPISTSVPVTFSINQEKSWLTIILGYLLALLFAVGLPYLALLLQARRSAVFIDDEIKYLSTPVRVTASGQLLSRNDSAVQDLLNSTDLENTDSESSEDSLVTPDRKLLSKAIEVEKGSKELHIGSASLRIKPVKFDAFAPIQVFLTIPDSVVNSSHGEKANLLHVETTTASQSLNGLVFLHAPASLIEPIDKNSVHEVSETLEDLTSDGSVMTVKTERTVAESEFVGTLVVVLSNNQNTAKALSKVFDLLRTKSFEGLNKSLTNLRSDALEAERELASSLMNNSANSAHTSKQASQETFETQSASKGSIFEDEFEDFIGTSTNKSTNSFKQNDDDDF